MLTVLRDEFRGYSSSAFRKDVIAGLNVAAVALPLSLAFGIASGATAAAGLITAVVAGLLIGTLSGTPNQISGPTGAMSAVLLGVAHTQGLPGVWVTTLLAGVLIALIGLLRLGRLVVIVPRSVVIGFTSGIAIIIFVGQIQNWLGIAPLQGASAVQRLADLATRAAGGALGVDGRALLLAAIVTGCGFLLPRRVSRIVPASLVGVVLATLLAVGLGWQMATVGAIPAAILQPDHLTPGMLSMDLISALALPAVSVAILCCLQALLTASACGNITGKRMDTNWELIAQGAGNLILPWLGGVPATGAIARTKVAIASGGQTRVTTVVHGSVLLILVLLMAPLIERIPLAALAGVLIVATVRMNEWGDILWMFRHRFKTEIGTFLLTVAATAYLDLAQAIILGLVANVALFVFRVSSIDIAIRPVDAQIMRTRGYDIGEANPGARVAYVTGPMFFGTTAQFRSAFAVLPNHTLILSMRGVPAIDVSGIELIEELHDRMRALGGQLLLAAVQPAVRLMLDRARVTTEVGEANFYWSADQAIFAAHQPDAPPEGVV